MTVRRKVLKVTKLPKKCSEGAIAVLTLLSNGRTDKVIFIEIAPRPGDALPICGTSYILLPVLWDLEIGPLINSLQLS